MEITSSAESPVAIRLAPSEDAIVAYLVGEDLWVAHIRYLGGGAYDVARDEVTALTDISELGGLWRTSANQLGLLYTTTAYQARTVYSTDGGRTWA